MNIAAVRRALVTVATAAIDGAGRVTVVPGPAEYTERQDFDRIGFNVMVTVGRVDDAGAEATLDALLDPETGLRTALEADRNLGGLVSDLAVRKCSGYQTFPPTDAGRDPSAPPGPPVLGATWHVVCMA